MSPRPGAVALAAMAVLAGGCGSTPLSLQALRRQATGYCQAGARAGNRIPTPGAPAQAESFLTQGIHALTPELNGLRSLHAPSAQATRYRAAVDELAQAMSLLRGARLGIRNGEDPTVAVTALQAGLGPVERRGDALWEALGIPACTAR